MWPGGYANASPYGLLSQLLQGGLSGAGAGVGSTPTLAPTPSVQGLPFGGAAPSIGATVGAAPQAGGGNALMNSILRSLGKTALKTGVNQLDPIGRLTGALGGAFAPSVGTVTGDVLGTGALTGTAPDILTGLGAGMTTGTEPFAGLTASAGGLGGAVGQAIPAAGSLYGIIQSLLSGRPSGIIGPALQGAMQVGTAVGALPSALTSMTGAGLPVAAGLAILTQILMDEIADPHGRKSAVRDYNYTMSQQVPQQLQGLQAAAATLPLISDKLTTDQAVQLYQLARAGVKDAQLLADPLSRQGKSKAGVPYASYGDTAGIMQEIGPDAMLATIRLQDLLASRGVDPTVFDPARSPFGLPLYGVLPAGGLPWMSPEQIRTYAGTMPGGTERGSLWLDPASALGDIGRAGGYESTTMDTPDLSALRPGQYEQGLVQYLSQLPTFAGSPIAQLLAQSPTPTWTPAAGAYTAAPAPNLASMAGLLNVPDVPMGPAP